MAKKTTLSGFVLKNVPIEMSGKVNTRIVLKNDYIRKDGSCAIYLTVSMNGQRKRIPLNIAIAPRQFNKKSQRIKGINQKAKDYNILIENALARINEIELNYRLSNKMLDVNILVAEYLNPTPNYDFLKFYAFELEQQRKYLKISTYKQQLSTLHKLIKWKPYIAFSAIDEQLIKELKFHCKNVLKNENTTVYTALKNFKKYLHLANNKGINTPLKYNEIKVPTAKGHRTFLDKIEIQKLYNYWKSDWIKKPHRFILNKFLFSCFTSLRISDIQTITRENIIDKHLIYNSKKTGKFNKVKLSASAKKFITADGALFLDDFTPEYINRELKVISGLLGIQKNVTFHVARHTFATQYIINGGNVVNLQRIMDHSNIKETMIYVHIVDQILDEEISLLDRILE